MSQRDGEPHDAPNRSVGMARTSSRNSGQSLVMAGLGMSLIPQLARISGRMPLVFRSLENPTPTRTIVVIWRKGREHTRACAQFLKHLQQSAKPSRETLKTTE